MGGRTAWHIFLSLFCLLVPFVGKAQHIGPENGVYLPPTTTYALTNCKLVVNPDLTIPVGMLVVKNGVIEYAGIMGIPPRGAVTIDCEGFTIYPSFIDIYSSEGIAKPTALNKGRGPQLESFKEGPYYWNEAVQPELNAYERYSAAQNEHRDQFVKQGFGAISTHVGDGVVRGTSVLVSLANNPAADNIIRAKSAQHFSFNKGVSQQSYPSSQMGSIALIRQFFYDCIWYGELRNKKVENISLASGLANKDLPQIFLSEDKLEILRIAKLAAEFKMLNYLVKGNGDEYERVSEIKASGAKLILPVEFPKPYDVTDPFLSRYITLADLKAWEMRPFNAYILYKFGIEFALTASDLKDKKDFLKNVRKAIAHGLPEKEALRALTTTPAKFIGCDSIMGTLEKGKIANFLVVRGELFDEEGEIFENWMPGERKRLKDITVPDIRGDYDLNIAQIVYEMEIKGESDSPKATVTSYKFTTTSSGTKVDTARIDLALKMSGLQVSMSLSLEDNNYKGLLQLNGTYNKKLGVLDGKVLLPNGYWADWSAIRSGKHKEEKKKKTEEIDTAFSSGMRWPAMAFGFDTLPKTGRYFIKNATLWTNEAEGIIKEGNILIADGKIQSVNSGQTSIGGATVIDAKGKHVTCGIIDEHSHIAISRGVNEGGQAISAEVSIGDVVNSDDINIYRQLAGGVTAAQLLHGSANPIGGQSALIKLKWGFSPEEMLIKDTDGFIKFALGENVKQANWGDENVIRYPQTRMGVEQVFYSAFIRAIEYKEEWRKYVEQPRWKRDSIDAPRRDLELEILLEIIEEKRFITCHSYVQSEINMLMNVADSLGFTINTFTHILEGYKVADKMKEHGAGASSFADWWAYKFEVYEAIPYNPAILCKMGVVTAINSDDAEMGRRLNQEAAKAVKYGGVSQEEAWKMVTLNPAKLLHLDSTMGSLKAGKDADIVIWSANPLSVQAKVEKTFVDGMLLYDMARSYRLADRDRLDRKRIMLKMIQAKNKGEETQKPRARSKPQYHCDTIGYGDEHEHDVE